MKTQKEIRNILEQFYDNVKDFHATAIRHCYSIRDFNRRRREAIISKAVSSILEKGKSKESIENYIRVLYASIRDLHMLLLQDTISLDSFAERKKRMLNDALWAVTTKCFA